MPASGETSAQVALRVAAARDRQTERYAGMSGMTVNADAEGEMLESIAAPGSEGRALLANAADRFDLSARGYHRILRVARTIADLEQSETVERRHLAEALSYRLPDKIIA